MISRRQLVILVLALALAPATHGAAQSRRGELRGGWMGEGYGRDWLAIMKSLADNGFNALFSNFSTGTVAYYPSEVLAVAPGGEPARDELAEAAKAAKENGVELHVWRINWALSRTPPEALDELDSAGRLQRNSRGGRGRDDPAVKVDWLCPSHPDNRKLEKEAMLELVRRYDIAGIHFDYMRFPSGDYCFCDNCRSRFEIEAKVHVESWPEDVRQGGALAEKWREWRRGLLTSLAEEISDEAHGLKPDISVSLAVWPHLEAARAELAQDWPDWVRGGVLDFVCPMDYTSDRKELSGLVEAQVRATRGAIPLYAGLGAFQLKSAWALSKQVQVARAAGADGFVAFAYGSGDLAEWLPELRSTVAAADPAPMPHRGPAARFSFAGPAVAEQGRWGQAAASAQLEVELAVGEQVTLGEEDESGEGAAQAAGMLRRVTDARTPVTSYEQRPDIIPSVGERQRISGRIVVETPAGLVLLTLGAFDTASGLERTLRFPCPEGGFRIAVYGATRAGDGDPQDFVVRSPLLRGATVTEEEPQAVPVREELDRFWAEICEHGGVQRLSEFSATLQIDATGPGGGQWWVRLRQGKCESGEGPVENPDLTFTLSAEDLLAITRGESSPRALWERGRLRTSGDAGLLRDMGEALGF
ncbi:MAG: family 10 glycosylhydrolase [Armatimonadota bacterium]|nr:MAG: family 10 glycosylhydrolase [Armatimonadota bacterium]